MAENIPKSLYQEPNSTSPPKYHRTTIQIEVELLEWVQSSYPGGLYRAINELLRHFKAEHEKTPAINYYERGARSLKEALDGDVNT